MENKKQPADKLSAACKQARLQQALRANLKRRKAPSASQKAESKREQPSQ